MKHLKPFTTFLNESQQLPDGVEQVDSEDYFNARGRSIPLSAEDIEKVESLMEITGAINRHEHLRNKSTPDNEFIICKDKTPYSYIPPVAGFGKTNDKYDLSLKVESGIIDNLYYFSSSLDSLVKVVLDAFIESGEFLPDFEWSQIK
jgi:hypothetical protein